MVHDPQLPSQRHMPVLTDIGAMAIDTMAEYLGTDRECDLFRKLPKDLCSRMERSVHNRRLSSCAGADRHFFLRNFHMY
ncbi:MAG: hypothetical protein V7724_15520 [Sediminicola sp.]